MRRPKTTAMYPWLVAPLVSAAIGGAVGTAASFASLLLTASCCSGSIVDESSLLGQALRLALFAGPIANHFDRSGGWPTLGIFVVVTFAGWALLVGGTCALLQLARRWRRA